MQSEAQQQQSSVGMNAKLADMIRRSTDSYQLTVDWASFMSIIDLINDDPSDNSAMTCTRIVHGRMKENEQNVVNLSLLLMETCMKNCGRKLAQRIDKTFMEDLSRIAKGSKGSKNASDAKRIIQQWSKLFPKVPVFFETYNDLKAQGMVFESGGDSDTAAGGSKSDLAGAVFGSSPGAPKLNTSNQNSNVSTPELDKLHRDLATVCDQIKLCRDMLLVTPGIDSDDILSEVVGYLEACRDRMIELIDAAASGLLGEHLFAKILRINEYIIRTLDAEREGSKTVIADDFATYNPNLEEQVGGGTTSATAQSNNPFDATEDLLGVGIASTSMIEILTAPSSQQGKSQQMKPIAPPPQLAANNNKKDNNLLNAQPLKATSLIPMASSSNTSSTLSSQSAAVVPPSQFSSSPPANSTFTSASSASPISKLPPPAAQSKAIPVLSPPPGGVIKTNTNSSIIADQDQVISPFANMNTNQGALASSSSTNDDLLAIFSSSTPSATNTTVAANSSTGAKVEDDFDSFLDSLGSKPKK